MLKITFKTPAGKIVNVEAAEGSLMQAAVQNGVDGIDADCGGVCSCATCHVHIPEEWVAKVGAAGPVEKTLLDLEDKANERSRLACQIKLSAQLDGLSVDVVGR